MAGSSHGEHFETVTGLDDDFWVCQKHHAELRMGRGCPQCNAEIQRTSHAAAASAEHRRESLARSGVEVGPEPERTVHWRLIAAGVVLLVVLAGAIWRFCH